MGSFVERRVIAGVPRDGERGVGRLETWRLSGAGVGGVRVRLQSL